MTYPRKLLNKGEQIILDLRPHWVALTIPTLWTLLVVAALVGLFWLGADWSTSVKLVLVGVGIVAFLALAGFRVLTWLRTEFVLTSQRVIHRKGVFAKHAKDVPLGRINEITFTQTVLERMVGSGNLVIRSASEDVEGNRFEFIRKPEQVQNAIYRAMEAEEEENRRVVIAGQVPVAAPPAPDVPSQIAQLDQLRRQGAITEVDYQIKKDELLRRM